MRFRGAYAFLSNFHACPLTFEGIEWPTAEHAYQASKTFNAKDRTRILMAETPGLAKRFGRHVELRPDWEKVKLVKMEDIQRAKYRNVRLAQMLLDTFPEKLVEDNTWGDRFWGVYEGHGENHLGQILMKIRAELRNGNG